MKKVFWLIFLIVCTVILFALFKSPSKPIVENGDTSTFLGDGQQYCFAYYQTATPGAPYQVEEHVVLNISGNKITGTKEGTQNGPDMTNGYQGTLEGTRDGNNIEAVYSYTIEGSKNKELEIYEIKNKVLVKHRFPLKEENKILVPDKSGEEKLISYQSEECASQVDTSSWKTFSDPAGRFTFKYPETLSLQYIHEQDWPPKVQIIEGAFACTDAGEENQRAGETAEKSIGGHNYCVTRVVEGAAGSTYTQYAYAREFDGKVLYFTFTLRAVQCGNYNDPEKSVCESERNAFDIDAIMDKVITTTKI